MSSSFICGSIKLTQEPLSAAYGGTSNTNYNIGDMLYASGANSLSKIQLGLTGQILSSNGTIPYWKDQFTTEVITLNNTSQSISLNTDYTILDGKVIGRWASRLSGPFDEFSTSVVLDSTSCYISGYYNSQPMTIYNYNGTTFGTLSNSGTYDVFLIKYNSSGTAQWATRIGNTGGIGNQYSYSSTIDDTGIYLTGYYTSDPATIYNSDGTVFGALDNPDGANQSVLLVKYNKSGICQWGTKLAGNFNAVSNYVANDSNGIYLTGYYTGSFLTIYNSDGTTFGTLSNSGSSDAFIVKYNTSGTAQWGTRISGFLSEQGYGISTDSTGIYVTGYYNNGPITIYNSDGSVFGTLSYFAGQDIFLVKYNSSGMVQWATRTSGIAVDNSNNVFSDSNGVYLTGYYTSDPFTIYNSDGTVFTTLSNSGNSDAFLIKYNSAGMGQWATRMASISSDVGNAITSNSTGIYLTGYYTVNPLTIYNSDGTVFATLTTLNQSFVVKYNSQGRGLWYTTIEGLSTNISTSIANNSTGLYLTGYYNSNPLTIYNSDGSTFGTLVNSGSYESFIITFAESNLASLSNPPSVISKTITNRNMYGATSYITVSNLVYNGLSKTQIVMDANGDTIKLGWNGTYWYVISINGADIN